MEAKQLQEIREDINKGMTYVEVMKKHNLKSNYFIKVALGKKTGNEQEYAGKYRKSYKALRETEKEYAEFRGKFAKLFRLFMDANTQLNIIKRTLDVDAKIKFETAQDVYDYLEGVR